MGDTYEGEKEVSHDEVQTHLPAIKQFISQFNTIPSFLMTMRKDGRPIMRPVSVFVEGWRMGTITQDLHVKTQHVRNNPLVGYLWTDTGGRNGIRFATRNVWVQGTAEVIDDPAEVQAFFERRHTATGSGDLHPLDDGYRRILIRTTPQYLRAEGFAEQSRPVVLREKDFAELLASPVGVR